MPVTHVRPQDPAFVSLSRDYGLAGETALFLALEEILFRFAVAATLFL